MSLKALMFASMAMYLALSGCPPRKPPPIVGHSGTTIMKTVAIDAILPTAPPSAPN
ncbi:hypothetical protein [Nitrospira sp. BLG_2]|uniref:hypothetical protein n=1 Tax=Nitrospira sp. BLG_2 TaxID=3397507 RepID=UPI003B9B2973